MKGDDGCNVGHAAVAKLDAVFITNFAKLVVAWKVFRQINLTFINLQVINLTFTF